MVDVPFAIVFTLVIALIGRWLALSSIWLFCVVGGHWPALPQACRRHRQPGHGAEPPKSGLLVETIEGAETIKSGQGGWRMLSRWMETSDGARACRVAAA